MQDNDGSIDTKAKRDERIIRDAYGWALACVLGATLLLIASGASVDSWLAAGAGVLQVAALVLTLRVSGIRRRSALAGSVVVATVLVAAVLAVAAGGGAGRVTAVTIWLLLALATIGAVGGRIRTYRYVSLQSVLGLLVIYVLLGISFGLGYLLVEVISPPAFAQGTQGVSGAMYMSFITLATVGYGDVSPGSGIVRSLAVAESIIGQLYLVSVVSLAVSRFGSRRSEGPASVREMAAAERAALSDD